MVFLTSYRRRREDTCKKTKFFGLTQFADSAIDSRKFFLVFLWRKSWENQLTVKQDD